MCWREACAGERHVRGLCWGEACVGERPALGRGSCWGEAAVGERRVLGRGMCWECVGPERQPLDREEPPAGEGWAHDPSAGPE